MSRTILTEVKTACLLAKMLSSRCILHFRNIANAVDLRFRQRLIMGRESGWNLPLLKGFLSFLHLLTYVMLEHNTRKAEIRIVIIGPKERKHERPLAP